MRCPFFESSVQQERKKRADVTIYPGGMTSGQGVSVPLAHLPDGLLMEKMCSLDVSLHAVSMCRIRQSHLTKLIWNEMEYERFLRQYTIIYIPETFVTSSSATRELHPTPADF